MGVFSSGGGMWKYSVTQSTVICLKVSQSGDGARLSTSFTNPPYGALLPCGGGSDVRRASILTPAFSTCRRQSDFKLSEIWRLGHWMSPWSRAVSRRAETLVLTRLYVSAKMHMFFLAFRTLGLVISQRRSAKIPSSLAGVVMGKRGGGVCAS